MYQADKNYPGQGPCLLSRRDGLVAALAEVFCIQALLQPAVRPEVFSTPCEVLTTGSFLWCTNSDEVSLFPLGASLLGVLPKACSLSPASWRFPSWLSSRFLVLAL